MIRFATMIALMTVGLTLGGCTAKVEPQQPASSYVCWCTFDAGAAGDTTCPPWATECGYQANAEAAAPASH